MTSVKKIIIISLLCVFAFCLLGMGGCQDDFQVFDPHVGTWSGQAGEYLIELDIMPGGVLTFTNHTTGYTDNFTYWTRFEQEGESWQLGMGVYPLEGVRDQRFLLIQQSSNAEDILFLETDETGRNLLGFEAAELRLVDEGAQ